MIIGEIVELKDQIWLGNQRIAGRAVAEILSTSKRLICDQTPNLNLLSLQEEAEMILKKHQCIATFEGYKGFPGKLCLSVNRELVHGIPHDYLIQPGDVVKVDVGATYNGAIADAAITAIYGEAKSKQHIELIDICEKSLLEAIGQIQVGKQIGCIGNAIYKYVTSKSRFGVVTEYGGHGINEGKPHSPPFVANKSQSNVGIRIQPGMTLAIEPMISVGDPKTKVLSDGWTVVTENINAHFEHTIFVHESVTEIITI